MPLLLLTLCLASCSPRQHDQETQTKYPDSATMSSADDAGHTSDSSHAQPKTGGVK